MYDTSKKIPAFEPITSQKQFDEVTSSRIRRERAQIHRKDSEALQPIIDDIEKLLSDLITLQRSWKSGESNK